MIWVWVLAVLAVTGLAAWLFLLAAAAWAAGLRIRRAARARPPAQDDIDAMIAEYQRQHKDTP